MKVKVFYPYIGEEIEMEEGMVDILQTLWDCNIYTFKCMEDYEGCVVIDFPYEYYQCFIEYLRDFNHELRFKLEKWYDEVDNEFNFTPQQVNMFNTENDIILGTSICIPKKYKDEFLNDIKSLRGMISCMNEVIEMVKDPIHNLN
jgi:hypothetical protein